MNLAQVQASLVALERHLDEIQKAGALQVVSDPQFARSLIAAPAEIAELRKEVIRLFGEKEGQAERLKALEDDLIDRAYADGMVDGKNASTRDRQERRILRRNEAYQVTKGHLQSSEWAWREAETNYDEAVREFQARLAVLRDASARLEWLGWL